MSEPTDERTACDKAKVQIKFQQASRELKRQIRADMVEQIKTRYELKKTFAAIARDLTHDYGVEVTIHTVVNTAIKMGVHKRLPRAERMRQLNADPEFAAAHAERASDRMRQLHADPEFAAAHAERVRQRHKDSEYRAKLAAGRQRYWEQRRAAKKGGPGEGG